MFVLKKGIFFGLICIQQLGDHLCLSPSSVVNFTVTLKPDTIRLFLDLNKTSLCLQTYFAEVRERVIGLTLVPFTSRVGFPTP